MLAIYHTYIIYHTSIYFILGLISISVFFANKTKSIATQAPRHTPTHPFTFTYKISFIVDIGKAWGVLTNSQVRWRLEDQRNWAEFTGAIPQSLQKMPV